MGHRILPVFPTKLTRPLSSSPVDNHNFLGAFEFLVWQHNKSPCGEKGRGQQTVCGTRWVWVFFGVDGRALKVLSSVKHLWQGLVSTTVQWPVGNRLEHTGRQSPLCTKALTVPPAGRASPNPCCTMASGISLSGAQGAPWAQPVDKKSGLSAHCSRHVVHSWILKMELNCPLLNIRWYCRVKHKCLASLEKPGTLVSLGPNSRWHQLHRLAAAFFRLDITAEFSAALPTLCCFTSSLGHTLHCQLGPWSTWVYIHCSSNKERQRWSALFSNGVPPPLSGRHKKTLWSPILRTKTAGGRQSVICISKPSPDIGLQTFFLSIVSGRQETILCLNFLDVFKVLPCRHLQQSSQVHVYTLATRCCLASVTNTSPEG